MAVALTYTTENEDIQTLRDRAIKAASLIKIVEKQ
jgi:hypothetical protein